MMITFRLTGRCQGCNLDVKGFKFAFPERINLGSIVVKQSIYAFDWCECDRNKPRPLEVAGDAQLTEESAALVEAARAKIRARRKKAAA